MLKRPLRASRRSDGSKVRDLIVDSGLVVEFVNDKIEQLQEKVASKHGFELSRHRHELFGLCRRGRAQDQ